MSCEDVKVKLLKKIDITEQSVRRVMERSKNRDPSIPAEKCISVEQCEWSLNEYAMFRHYVIDAFEEC
ncbi:hypothetical protein M5U04_17720 [Xenorhabdus sp. XENO-1]|uniref:hypothetical protein n=1 Tax=Xenorhabdus bovienii TaxID=40576 RepID=UPI0020CA6757|nr:hypothetical protein [Xenorhabdus bovienii]MCP9269867.1 hypothetical protein [Xenorhabdus bovienii subsp. africana]